MRFGRFCSRPRRGLAAIVTMTGLLAGMVGFPGSARAVIEGVPDGNEHPYVGNIFAYDSTGAFVEGCSGTLVDQTTVLTAGHCVTTAGSPAPVTWKVSFDSSTGPTNFPSHYILATPDPDPSFVPGTVKGGTAGFMANEANDIGLLLLHQPANSIFQGIQPAPIAGVDALAPYAKGNGSTNQLFLQVGYGVGRPAGSPPGQESSFTYDGVRYQSQWPMNKLTDSLFFGNGNPNNSIGYGMPCSGDSGSPVLLNGAVVGVTLFVQAWCQNLVGGIRLDAGTGRAFLSSAGLVP